MTRSVLRPRRAISVSRFAGVTLWCPRCSRRMSRHHACPRPDDRPAERGQIIPFFAVFLLVLVALSALSIDGALMLQSRQDLQTIALHAATSGAQELDWTTYTARCRSIGTIAIVPAPGASPVTVPRAPGTFTCAGLLDLDATRAPERALAVARTWLRNLDGANLAIPSSSTARPDVLAEIDSTNHRQITVTVTRCYRPYLAGMILPLVDTSGACPAGSIRLSESASAIARLGY